MRSPLSVFAPEGIAEDCYRMCTPETVSSLCSKGTTQCNGGGAQHREVVTRNELGLRTMRELPDCG